MFSEKVYGKTHLGECFRTNISLDYHKDYIITLTTYSNFSHSLETF